MTQKDKNLEIVSHSYTHPGKDQVDIMHANLEREIPGSQAALRKMFPGQDVLLYCPGDGLLTDKMLPYIYESYYGMRTGNRGLNNLEMTEEDFFDIKVQGVVGSVENYQKIDRPYDGETVETMNAWLDEAVSENKWLVEMWHSVCWEGIGDDGKPAYLSDGGYRPIRANIGEAHMGVCRQAARGRKNMGCTDG